MGEDRVVETGGEPLDQEGLVQDDEIVAQPQYRLVLYGEEGEGAGQPHEGLPELLRRRRDDAQEGVHGLLGRPVAFPNLRRHLRLPDFPTLFVRPRHHPGAQDLLELQTRGIPEDLTGRQPASLSTAVMLSHAVGDDPTEAAALLAHGSVEAGPPVLGQVLPVLLHEPGRIADRGQERVHARQGPQQPTRVVGAENVTR